MIAPGQIVYPGFDADVLWEFRWYSIINQMLIWLTIALVFGGLLERFLGEPVPAGGRTSEGESHPKAGESNGLDEEAVPAVSGRPWRER
jgi:hypothetical protein